MSPLHCKGLSLVELLVAMTLMAGLAAILALVASQPERYMVSMQQAELSDIADGALRSIAREVSRALPNSLRVTGNYLEFVPTVGGGRFTGLNGNSLDLTQSQLSFTALGLIGRISAGDQIVIYNMPITDGAFNYYLQNNFGTVASFAAPVVSLTSATVFPDSWTRRFFLVQGPVSYVCTPGTAANDFTDGSIRRVSGYALSHPQPTTVLPLGTLLATRVMACSFSYTPSVHENRGLLSLELTMAAGDQQVRLFHQVHVDNAP